MIPVATAAQVRALDRAAIEDLGLPGIALMESASQAIAQIVWNRYRARAARGVLLVCGGGNNGGDGYGAARWLAAWGLPVSLWALSEESSGDAGVNRAICERLGLTVHPTEEDVDPSRYGIIVDAVFGTGLSRPVEGRYAEVLRRLGESGTPIVAADLPSGLHADTGRVLGLALRAVATVTFGAAKPGLYTGAGPDLAGEVVYADLGLGMVREVPRMGAVFERHDLRARWPRRSASDHKGSSGHVAVVAGSTSMAGAAVLTCTAALAAGAGLVTLVVPRGALPRLAHLPPEVMVEVAGYADVVADDELDRRTARGTALVVGPGLGGGEALPEPLTAWLQRAWSDSTRPMLADADALGAVWSAGEGDEDRGTRVLTPHPGEAARLLGVETARVQADRFGAVATLAERSQATALLKGRHTLVATRGEGIAVNATGNPVLATAGSGDVLSGVIGALLARDLPGHLAATLGAHVHGIAGDLLAARRAQGWTALDIAHALPDAVAALTEAGR